MEQVLSKDADWIAPFLWRSEFRNVLAGYIRHQLLTKDVAIQTMAEAEAHMRDKEHPVSSEQVLKLVAQSEWSAYDCEFVALAEAFEVPLVTTDKKILAAFPTLATDIEQFLK